MMESNLSTVSIEKIINILTTTSRVKQLILPEAFSHRGIKKLAHYLKHNHSDLELLVPNYTPALNYNITVLPIRTPIVKSSSSGEEQCGLIEVEHDKYEVPYEVEKALIGVKKTLMWPYIACGQAYFWKHENHNPNATRDIVDLRVSEEIRSWIEEHVAKHMYWKSIKALLHSDPEDLSHLGNIANEQSGAAIPFNLSINCKMTGGFEGSIGLPKCLLNAGEKEKKQVAVNVQTAAFMIYEVEDTPGFFSCQFFNPDSDNIYRISVENNHIRSCSCPDSIGNCKHMFLVSRIMTIPFSVRKIVSISREPIVNNRTDDKSSYISAYAENAEEYYMDNQFQSLRDSLARPARQT
ncbi:hypothetical protein EDC94DRAFT_696932 [Helicostylum pulchrum]|nr:hypothetical protein EDC94DRAFT_696932 [Helicostylum pulchrum]